MKHRFRLLPTALLLAAVVLAGAPRPSGAADPCFDVDVQYMGRVYAGNFGGIEYYRWHYRVTGASCINRGLSHWVLQICEVYWDKISEISTVSVDASDAANGDSTFYSPVIGNDPPTGTSGLKWNSAGGNQLDKPGEYDDFSFVAPGGENFISVQWAAKGGLLLGVGSTIGPSCDPVPVERKSWGTIKALYGE